MFDPTAKGSPTKLGKRMSDSFGITHSDERVKGIEPS